MTLGYGKALTGENIGLHKNTATNSASISGNVFRDINGDGKKDGADTGLSGWGVFIDYNDDGKFDGSDFRVLTDANGNFTLGSLAAGTYYINEGVPTGYKRTAVATTGYKITLTAGESVTGELFGNEPT